MAVTYDSISTTTLNSSSGTVSFTSIPQTYTDLVLIIYGSASTGPETWLQFNSDTGANYAVVRLYGYSTGGSVAGNSMNAITLQSGTATNNIINEEVHIFNYTNTNVKKTMINTHGNATDSVEIQAGLWLNTDAITSIKLLFDRSSSWNTGSRATLYGIAAS